MDNEFGSVDLRRFESALKSVRPKCSDHKPEAAQVCENGEQWVEISCPNCGFFGVMHPEAYRKMLADGGE